MNASNAAPPARCAISWSAGKDSWLALTRAREQGWAVDTFVTMCDEDGTSKSHALPPELIDAQVRALGGVPASVRVPPGEYAARFDACLRGLAASGHTHMIFGDIDLQAHRDWLAPACERAGLVAWFPLWGEPRAALARELVTRGVQARVVCVDTRWLDASFCGAPYDDGFLARLPPACARAARTASSTPSSPAARASRRRCAWSTALGAASRRGHRSPPPSSCSSL